jgi:hypothetical protein
MAMHVILFLAANPHGSDPLKLDSECAAIQRELKMARHREDFRFESRWAVGIDDLMRHLRELDPMVLHFSGHGGGSSGLILEDEQGQPQPISGAALTKVVRAAAQRVRVVVLNACYSVEQADALRAEVDCVVGMDGAIGDVAARKFAVQFYGALGDRRSVGNAVENGIALLAALQSPDEHLPRCATRIGVDAQQLFLDPPVDASSPVGLVSGRAAEQWASKRAEVGGEVLMASLRCLTALSGVVGVRSTAQRQLGDDPRDEHAPMRRETEQRWVAVANESAAFSRAVDLAQTYLSKDVNLLLKKILDLKATIYAGQLTFFSVPIGHGAEFFKEGWGSLPGTTIEQLREEASALLRSIAQFGSNVP